MNILKDIIANKRREIKRAIISTPVRNLEKSPLFSREIIRLTDSLKDPSKKGIIAEFKRKSPSGGSLNEIAEPDKVISGYSANGASGVSVLTDSLYFGGSMSDLSGSRQVCNVPMLRKDFIFDNYQIVEARASGADVILLIAAVLSEKEVLGLSRFANSVGLQILLEIHNRREAAMINEYVDIVGVNNRDLDTLRVNVDVSLELADVFLPDQVRISESGISSPEKIRSLRAAGYHGFLVGETFMKESDPVAAFSAFNSRI